MEFLLLFPWATERLAEIGLKTFIGLSVTSIFIFLSKGEYVGIILLIIVSFILSWGFAHSGYVLIVAELWLWRSIPRLIASIIKQREAVYLKQQHDIAGRDMDSLLAIEQPAIERQDTWLKFFQCAQAEKPYARSQNLKSDNHVIQPIKTPARGIFT